MKRTRIIPDGLKDATLPGRIISARYNSHFRCAELTVEFLLDGNVSLRLPMCINEKTKGPMAELIDGLEFENSTQYIAEILDLGHNTVKVEAELKVGKKGSNYCVIHTVDVLKGEQDPNFIFWQLEACKARIRNLEKENMKLQAQLEMIAPSYQLVEMIAPPPPRYQSTGALSRMI